MKEIRVRMDRVRDTKNKVRYESGDPRVDILYIQKDVWETMPKSIVVIVEPQA
jgi:hypothetical protein